MSDERETRDRKVGIRVTPDMYARLEHLAGHYGVSVSALAAMAIGQYVSQHERQITMQSTVADLIVQEFGDQFREVVKDRTIAELTPSVIGFLQSQTNQIPITS